MTSAFMPCALQFLQRGFQFLAGVVAKFNDADVADLVGAKRKSFLPLMSLTMSMWMMARVRVKFLSSPLDGR